MGEAATDVPTGVYGMVDLYGRSAQATITNGQPREEIPESDAASASKFTFDCLLLSGLPVVTTKS
jgi:neuralized-like protein 4